jgi:RNA polymerase sigma-70 factor (ECF subfamily)
MAPEEITEAYVKYGPYVLRRCRRILGSEAAAQDALQEAFMRLVRRADLFAGAESKLAWLYRVAERCCFDQLSRPATRASRPLEELRTGDPWEPSSAMQAEDRDVVMKFLGGLDEKLRQVAVLHYLDEMGQEEIARAVGCSRQTVVNRLTAIKQRVEIFRSERLMSAEAR